jgi:hypothetical protein
VVNILIRNSPEGMQRSFRLTLIQVINHIYRAQRQLLELAKTLRIWTEWPRDWISLFHLCCSRNYNYYSYKSSNKMFPTDILISHGNKSHLHRIINIIGWRTQHTMSWYLIVKICTNIMNNTSKKIVYCLTVL